MKKIFVLFISMLFFMACGEMPKESNINDNVKVYYEGQLIENYNCRIESFGSNRFGNTIVGITDSTGKYVTKKYTKEFQVIIQDN